MINYLKNHMIEAPHLPEQAKITNPEINSQIVTPSKPRELYINSPSLPTVRSPSTDNTDADYSRWFLSSNSGCEAKDFNDSKFYITPFEYWQDLYKDLQLVINVNSDFVYILGWEMGTTVNKVGFKSSKDKNSPYRIIPNSPPLNRSPDVSLDDMLVKIGNNLGIAVRAMLVRRIDKPFQNMGAVEFINNLKNGGAIWDDKYVFSGTHHQKVVVLHTSKGLIAYCGGIDLEAGRVNWNDCQCRITGPSAVDLHKVFVERWNDYVLKWKLIPKKISQLVINHIDLGPMPSQPTSFIGNNRVRAIVTRTYPNAPNHGGLGVFASQFGGLKKNLHKGYSFSPNGEHTIYDQIAKAINASKKYIYIQDQYLFASTPMLTGPSIASLLSEKLKEETFKYLIILVSRTETINGEVNQAWAHRASFIQKLTSSVQSKVAVCHYRIPPKFDCDNYNDPPYVHAKTWVFDDRFAIIGSANCNRRGYTHDSEVAIGIYDEVPGNDRLTFAHELRIEQWLRALNSPCLGLSAISPKITRQDVLDFETAAHFWLKPSYNSAIAPYEIEVSKSDAKDPNPDRTPSIPMSASQYWDQVIDPDGS